MHGPNLRRSARGRILDAGEATNTTAALTNNSLSPHILKVWKPQSNRAGGGALLCSYQRIDIFSTLGVVAPIVPGDPAPPGIISAGDLPAAFPADWIFTDGTNLVPWPATFPFAVLLPGWSLVVQNMTTPTDPIDISFWWEWCYPEDFYSLSAGDSADGE